MNYIWVSSFIMDMVITWVFFRRSDFTMGKRRNWLKVILCLALLPLYVNTLIPMNATLRVAYRIVICFIWAWLAEGIPVKGALYTSIFWVAVYTAFQNIFFGPFLAEFVTGRIDIFASRFWSQLIVSIINIILRFIFFAIIMKLLPFAGLIGANYSSIAFMVLINIILTYSKTAVLTASSFEEVAPRTSVFFILLQLALLLALLAFEFSRRRTVEAANLDIRNAEAQALLESIRGRTQSEEAIRSLRHDLKNHAISMQLLLDQGDTDGVKEYLDSFLEAAKNPTESYNTGSDLLDGLLKQKLSPAKDSGINVTCSLDFRNAANTIDNFDLCVMMGNILDNAVEACMAQPSEQTRYIKVSGGPAANCQLIKVENSVNPKNSTSGAPGPSGLPFTTKADKTLHGFGLRNVKAVLERYGGSMTITQENSSYSISMLIPVQ